MNEERLTLQWEHGSCQALLSWRSAGEDPDTEHNSGSPMISCTLGLRIESIRGEEVLSCGRLPPLRLPPTEARRLATLRDVEGALYGVVQEAGTLPLPYDVVDWVAETVASYVHDRAAGALQEQLPPPLIEICADVHVTMHALDWEDYRDGEEEDDEGEQVLDGEDDSDDVDEEDEEEEDDGGEEEEEEEGVMHVDDDNCGLVLRQMEVAAAMAGGEEGGGEAEDCPICLDRMVPAAEGREICWMPCMHRFHRDCLWKWLVQYKGDCPLCRFPFQVGTLPSS